MIPGFPSKPLVMGILNITPDSFSDGGVYLDPAKALDRALEMIDQGVDIIDVGAESSRPGALGVSADEELKRLDPIFKKVFPSISVPISLDTRHANVFRQGLQYGVSILNDITALRKMTPSGWSDHHEMLELLVANQCPVILMHMPKEPQYMQVDPFYHDVVAEVVQFLEERTQWVTRCGLSKDKVWIDPGFGFGKSFEHNQTLFQNIERLISLNQPLLVGVSRKKMIRQLFGESASDILRGSVEMSLEAIKRGACIVRVHDVRETVKAVQMANF